MNDTETETEQQRPRTFTIGSGTPVALGLIVAILGVIASGSWWMSAMSAKLDNITVILSGVTTEGTDLKRRQNEHERQDSERWTAIQSEVNVIKQSGSPKLQELERRINELEVRFSIHEKSSRSGPGSP